MEIDKEIREETDNGPVMLSEENVGDFIEGYGEKDPWEGLDEENKTEDGNEEATDNEETEDEDNGEESPVEESEEKHETKPDPKSEPEPKVVYKQDPEKEKQYQEAMSRLSEIQAALKEYGFEEKQEDLADKIFADAKQITVEEYRKQKSQARTAEDEAIKNNPLYREMQEYKANKERIENEHKKEKQEIQFAADIAIIKAAHPDVTASHISEIPNCKAFSVLRAYGYSTEEAYNMANYKNVAEKAKASGEALARKQASKNHIVGFNDRAGAPSSETPDIPSNEIAFWKEAFPDDSMKELKTRYAKSIKIYKASEVKN